MKTRRQIEKHYLEEKKYLDKTKEEKLLNNKSVDINEGLINLCNLKKEEVLADFRLKKKFIMSFVRSFKNRIPQK